MRGESIEAITAALLFRCYTTIRDEVKLWSRIAIVQGGCCTDPNSCRCSICTSTNANHAFSRPLSIPPKLRAANHLELKAKMFIRSQTKVAKTVWCERKALMTTITATIEDFSRANQHLPTCVQVFATGFLLHAHLRLSCASAPSLDRLNVPETVWSAVIQQLPHNRTQTV